VLSATALLAVFLALTISVVLVFCLPTWASVCITFAAVLSAAIGGEALLAKASIAGGVVALVVWLGRRHLRRRASERMPAEAELLAMPELKTKDPQVSQSRTEREAA
jgi:hypothetical protein